MESVLIISLLAETLRDAGLGFLAFSVGAFIWFACAVLLLVGKNLGKS